VAGHTVPAMMLAVTGLPRVGKKTLDPCIAAPHQAAPLIDEHSPEVRWSHFLELIFSAPHRGCCPPRG
jgi:hypothetical protein